MLLREKSWARLEEGLAGGRFHAIRKSYFPTRETKGGVQIGGGDLQWEKDMTPYMLKDRHHRQFSLGTSRQPGGQEREGSYSSKQKAWDHW